MAITVRAGAALKTLLGGKTEKQADGGSVGEVIDHLGIRDRLCDDAGKVRRHFNIHVNEGEEIRLQQGLDTPLKDGDTVTILSAIAGGAESVRKFWLSFRQDLIAKPIIWEIAQKFKIVTNIRQASISKDIGLVGLEITGAETEIEKTVAYLVALGVSVEPVELNVVEG